MLKNILTGLLLLTLLSRCQINSPEKATETKSNQQAGELSIGSLQTFKSSILNEERPIIISLPKGYDTAKVRYPVLYLTDGLQNIWHTIGTLEVLTRTGGAPPMIVVGIESTNRIRDFTPSVSENHPGSGGGKRFLEFIEKELIPYIDTHYRTHPFRVLEGHSLGGLFTAFTLMAKPDLFDGFIVMSPAMWWNGEEMTQKAKVFFKTHQDLDKAMFFGIGTGESGAEYGMRKELKNFVGVIAQNPPTHLRFKRKEMKGEGHMSSVLLSNYYGLKFIFSDMAFPETLYKAYSDSAFLQHENDIMAKYGKSAKQAAEAYVSLASSLRGSKHYAGAITVLKRSVTAYPFDVGLMNFLGNTYELNDDKEAAISIYKKAIATSKTYNYHREEEFEKQIQRLEKQ